MKKKSYTAFEWQRKIDDVTFTVRTRSVDELFCVLDYIREYSSGLVPEIWHLKYPKEKNEAEEKEAF